MSSDIPPLELSCFIFANLMLQLVEVGYIRLILPNSIPVFTLHFRSSVCDMLMTIIVILIIKISFGFDKIQLLKDKNAPSEMIEPHCAVCMWR